MRERRLHAAEFRRVVANAIVAAESVEIGEHSPDAGAEGACGGAKLDAARHVADARIRDDRRPRQVHLGASVRGGVALPSHRRPRRLLSAKTSSLRSVKLLGPTGESCCRLTAEEELDSNCTSITAPTLTSSESVASPSRRMRVEELSLST